MFKDLKKFIKENLKAKIIKKRLTDYRHLERMQKKLFPI